MLALLYVYNRQHVNLVDSGNLVYYCEGMTKRGRKPITEQQRENELLADPISQVLLGDPEYARWFATERRRFVDSGAGRREPGEDFAYAVESEDEWL